MQQLFADDAKKCLKHSGVLKHYHNKLMAYKAPKSEKSYLDLMREKNSINAALTLSSALTKLSDEYYNYLGSTNHPDVKKINNLQILLQAQAPAASRMTYAIDMMTSIGSKKIPGKPKERFQVIAMKLKSTCQKNPNTSFCARLSPDFWKTLSENGERAELTHDSMVEQFIHVSAASKDIGQHFVQDSKYNDLIKKDPASNLTFTSLLSRAVDEAAKNCANLDLLHITNTTGSDQKCLNLNLNELKTVNGEGLKRALGDVGHNVTSLNDVVNGYFKRVENVKKGHMKLTGDLIKNFTSNSNVNLKRAESALKKDAPVIRKKFERLKTNLAGRLHGAFKLAQSSHNLQRTLTNASSDASLNPNAAELAKTLNKTTTTLTGLEDNLFQVNQDGEMSFNNTALAQALAGDKLHSKQLREIKSKLHKKLSSVDSKLEALSRQDDFTTLKKLQDFTWGNVRYYCGDNKIDRRSSGDSCSYKAGYNHGLQTLVQVNDNMTKMERLQKEEAQMKDLLEYCNSEKQAGADKKAHNTTCSLIFAKRNDLRERTNQEQVRLDRRQRIIDGPDTYPVYDKKMNIVDRRPKTRWLKQGLSRGFQSAITTLLPVGIQYFQNKGSLLQTVGRAQSRITYAAQMNALSTFPQNNTCYLYMCGVSLYQATPYFNSTPY